MAEVRFKALREDEPSERDPREPITKKRKPSVLGSILSDFFEEDLGTAIDTVRKERVIPDIKHAAFNALTDVAGMLLGEGRSSYSRSSSSLTEGRRNGSTINRRSDIDRHDRVGDSDSSGCFDSRDYTFYTRGEAEEVLETLRAECHEDGKVSVARFFQMTKNKIDWSDWDIGWRELDRGNSMCRPSKGGYVLILPKPVSIKNR